MERLWGKGNTPSLLVGTAPLDIYMVISQKIRNNLHQYPAKPLFGIYPKDAQSYHKDMCSTMFTAALFVRARTWKQPKFPSTEEWIRKMWYIYTMEYHTVEKNKDILNFAGKLIELENISFSYLVFVHNYKLNSAIQLDLGNEENMEPKEFQ